ncbi:hypothetical protein BDN70DRAFT_876500 [Pholiota conissans]|uniref:Uncharacterized protein n=1 Tax=Pholiota conissans TaxID=109636 RepID=A0A9P5Z6Z5_9AGAR|nr:hypothetical protein BDN70DRAFT_876500 [Pholiota conissans]
MTRAEKMLLGRFCPNIQNWRTIPGLLFGVFLKADQACWYGADAAWLRSFRPRFKFSKPKKISRIRFFKSQTSRRVNRSEVSEGQAAGLLGVITLALLVFY